MHTETLPEGYALHRIVTDDAGDPIDYVFLSVNPAFEALTGLKAAGVIGKRALEVLPDLQHSWIERYGKVALTGEHTEFEEYSAPLGRWFRVSVSRPMPDHFATVFFDITDLRKRYEALSSSEREAKAMLVASRALLEVGDFQDAARTIFDACRAVTGAQSGYVALLSDDGTENEVLFLEAGGLPCAVDPELPMPIRGLREQAYDTARVVYENSFMDSEWVDFMPEGHVEMRNVMFAPLTVEGQVLGVMGLANKPTDYTEEDARLAGDFGDLAAIALSRVHEQQLLDDYREDLEAKIAESKQAEGALRESEARFRTLFEGVSDAIFIFDPDTFEILYANEATSRIYGYDKNELAGMSCLKFSAEVEESKAATEKITKDGQATVTVPYRHHQKKDGSDLYVYLSAHKEVVDGRNMFFAVCRDVTELKQVEEVLRRSEQRYRILSEAAFEAIILSENGICLEHNSITEEMTGYTHSELIGRPGTDLIAPEHREMIMAKMKSGDEESYEVTALRKDGTTFQAEVRGKMMHDQGRALRITAMRDITDRKQAEERLLRQEQLHAFSSDLLVVREKERKDIARELHDSVAQSLVAAKIIGQSLAADSPDDESSAAFDRLVDLVGHSIEEIRRITTDLSPSMLYELGLGPSLEWLIERFDEHYGLVCDLHIDPSAERLTSDGAALIFRATRELLNNVQRHSGVNHACVQVLAEGEVLSLSVEDEGCGFDPSGVENVTGHHHFGLFSVREEISTMGGTFKIVSEPGQRTRAEIHLPCQ